MGFRWNRRYVLQNDDAESMGGGGDTPLGEKGQKALEAEKQKARELTKKLREQEDLLKKFDGLDLAAIQEALEFKKTAEIREAELKQNTEEARKLEREAAAAKEKRLLSDKEIAEKGREAANIALNETRIDTAVILAVSECPFIAGNDPKETANNRKALCKIINSIPELKKQLAYLTKEKDGVDENGVFVVDKSGDPVMDSDDRSKYLNITDWVNTKVRADYSGMFKSTIGVGDGLRGNKGRGKGYIDMESLRAMTPLQKLEHYRKTQSR